MATIIHSEDSGAIPVVVGIDIIHFSDLELQFRGFRSLVVIGSLRNETFSIIGIDKLLAIKTNRLARCNY